MKLQTNQTLKINIMKKLTLINGQQIEVVEETIQGMVGEPMDIVRFKDERGETVHFDDFKKLLCYEDGVKLENFLNDLAAENFASAISFIQ